MAKNTEAAAVEKTDFPLVVLAILDGWGIGRGGAGDAVALAKTPVLDGLKKRYPHNQLMAHGRYVGLLPNQEGNSEAGHMNIGAGRIVRQDVLYVKEAVRDRTFFKNTAFKEALKHVKKYGSRVHLMGLLGNGNSAHSSPQHLYALLDLMREEGVGEVFLHIFTDGRDSPPFSSIRLLNDLEKRMYPNQKIASVSGRFYAMDRNKVWSRVERAYDAMVLGEGLSAPSAQEAIEHGYNRGESDEFIQPTVITDGRKEPVGTIGDNDVIFFFNLRSDRAREITKAFVQDDFEARNGGTFRRRRVPDNIRFVAMTDFGPDLPHVLTAFPSRDIRQGLTEALSPLRQFYIAESEKYAHVTYFFNGGYDSARCGEERMRIPSPNVDSYADRPEMRANAIASEVARRIKARSHDFICINFANMDMVGHTGNLEAAVIGCEAVDAAVGRIWKEIKARKGCLIVTADHGNAEMMLNQETGEVMTEHTVNSVPFILAYDLFRERNVGDGVLADIAPTILEVFDLPKPAAMSGFSLLR